MTTPASESLKMGACRRICAIVSSILLPPLGVFMMRGCGKDLCINVLLTLLGIIPGIIHALWISLADSPGHHHRGVDGAGAGLPVTMPPIPVPAPGPGGAPAGYPVQRQ